MDIGSRATGAARALSNFTPRQFTFTYDGLTVECKSLEGVLQALKFENVSAATATCQRVGYDAKKHGKPRNQYWQEKQTLWWNGKAYKRNSKAYQELLTAIYDAVYEQDPKFRAALAATGDAVLTHSIGYNDKKKTILTEKEFVGQLHRLRDKKEGGEKMPAKKQQVNHPLVVKGKACFVTGHRPKDKAGVNFAWEYRLPKHMTADMRAQYDRMMEALDKAIQFAYDRGCRTFITGMALGADLYFGARVIEFKKQHKNVFLVAAVPYSSHKTDYGTGDKTTSQQYRYVLNNADHVVDLVEGTFSVKALLDRNAAMFEAAKATKGMCIAVKRGSKSTGGTVHALNMVKEDGMCHVIYDPETQKLSVYNK